ncbi:MAG: DUF3793 family protein [Defluviitaleaceae bacterium]|nr:DUF3793 family protein [Defluviitaleaceae bacterium]
MLDHFLIKNCAPTLSSLKTGNLFNCPSSSRKKTDAIISHWNKLLNPKGVSIHILHRRAEKALVYVCRKSKLKQDFQKPGVKEFLVKYGYSEFSFECCIDRLKERIANSESFPHEIGLFLGYPLGDVKGFIENEGRNFLCCGEWKVYCDACSAGNSFRQYKKCRDVYVKLFEGRIRTVYQLTVSV